MSETAVRPVFIRVFSRHTRAETGHDPRRRHYQAPSVVNAGSVASAPANISQVISKSNLPIVTSSAQAAYTADATTNEKAGPSVNIKSAPPPAPQSAASRTESKTASAAASPAGPLPAAALTPPLTRAEEIVRAMAAATRFSEEGTANLTQGRFSEAERLYKIALNITERYLGVTSNGVTKALEVLATFYLTRGSYDLAEPLLHRLYIIRLRQHLEGMNTDSEFNARENYLLMALTVEKCSSCLEKLGKLSQSERIYLTLLKRQEEYYGREHAFTLDALERLGEFFLRARVYGLAQVVFEKLYETKSKLHGPYSIEVSSVLSSLALIYSNLEMFLDQVAVLERQVFLLDTLHGGTGLSLASALTRLADAISNIARENGDYDLVERAELIYRRALTIYERHYGPMTPTVVSLRNRLKTLK